MDKHSQESLTTQPLTAMQHGATKFSSYAAASSRKTGSLLSVMPTMLWCMAETMLPRLRWQGFVVGLLEHDHATASDAFEAALSLSPSSAFSYHLGSVIAGWAGDAERAVEWGERALGSSPFDPSSYLAYDSVSVGHFRRGRYEEAIGAARKAIQFNPGFSINYVLLAAPLVKLSTP